MILAVILLALVVSTLLAAVVIGVCGVRRLP